MAAGNACQTINFRFVLYYTNYAHTILIPAQVLLHGMYLNCCALGTFPGISQLLSS